MRRAIRIAKWNGIAICLLLSAAWVLSVYSYSRVAIAGFTCELGCGTTAFANYSYTGFDSYLAWCDGVLHYTRFGLCWPSTVTSVNGRRWVIDVPLWIPILSTLIVTGWLWRRDRRRSAPGFCRCGYNLTGNVSGVCPECGSETANVTVGA